MKIARDRYNPYVVLIENAQSDIREIVRRAYFSGEEPYRTEKKLWKVICATADKIAIPRLRGDTMKALMKFSNEQYRVWKDTGLSPEAIIFLATERKKRSPKFPRNMRVSDELAKASATTSNASTTSTTTNTNNKSNVTSTTAPTRDTTRFSEQTQGVGTTTSATVQSGTEAQTQADNGNAQSYEDALSRGVPLGEYYDEVWKTKVVPAIEQAANSNAIDPSDYTGRNSLRNLAEMEVRYHDHQENINELKASGVKLVVCSSHADCSGRCAPWQGRVYSLDGSSGEIDGNRYVPLETATDVWYTTKAGRRYKNGLLGFNCRHRLEPYTGKLLPTVSEKERKEEYEVTLMQRKLERAVREARAKAAMSKGLDKAEYNKWRKIAQKANERYLQYCREHNRAAYPSRTAVI